MTDATPQAPPPGGPPPATPPPTRSRAWIGVVAAVIVALLAGIGAGYLVFHRTAAPAPSPTPTASPTFTFTPTATVATPTPTPTPSPTPVAGCQPPQSGQHALEPLDEPQPGYHAVSGLDWTGCADQTVPDSGPVSVPGNWMLAESHTCPNGSAGNNGKGTTVTITEIQSGARPGPDAPIEEIGDWDHGVGPSGLHGGSFQFRVTTVNPSCHWHIAVYAAG